MTTSKERAIVLTSYERRSLFRFLALYLGSVFVLLAIIGYLFFENNRSTMISAMKFEMMYQGRMLASKIAMKSMTMSSEEKERFDLTKYLRKVDLCRFDVGYYNHKNFPIYSEIKDFQQFDKKFFIQGGRCYNVEVDEKDHLGIRYIVLKENELSETLQKLRMRIISYLILSFILMGVVGYFLGRLFLQPVREQIESLDRFISDTTHELNTPISAILMTIHSLKGVEEKKLTRLQASAKRLSMMYSSLTYRLEGQEEKEERICIAKVLEERVEFMKELIDSKRLKIVPEIEPFYFMMEKHSANRLIDNLLSNAVKYSNPGDTITATVKDNIVTVKDEGIGIPKEVKEDIFKRYQRANDERGGFGIGLSIVLSICEKYGIRIDLESEKDKGSTFILKFPNKGM